MRVGGRGKKKLTVAFHFQFSSQAGWKCDSCREAGLEKTRRCGWIAAEERGPERVVWARGRAAASSCPKSIVTGQSEAWLEEYYAWRILGRGGMEHLSARKAEAFLLLEELVMGEEPGGRS